MKKFFSAFMAIILAVSVIMVPSGVKKADATTYAYYSYNALPTDENSVMTKVKKKAAEKAGNYYIWLDEQFISDGSYYEKFSICVSTGVNSAKTTVATLKVQQGRFVSEKMVTNGSDIFFTMKNRYTGYVNIYKVNIASKKTTFIKNVRNCIGLVGFYNGYLYYNKSDSEAYMSYSDPSYYDIVQLDIAKKTTSIHLKKFYGHSSYGPIISGVKFDGSYVDVNTYTNYAYAVNKNIYTFDVRYKANMSLAERAKTLIKVGYGNYSVISSDKKVFYTVKSSSKCWRIKRSTITHEYGNITDTIHSDDMAVAYMTKSKTVVSYYSVYTGVTSYVLDDNRSGFLQYGEFH